MPKLFFEDRGLVDAKTTKVANEFYTDQGVIKHGKFFPKGSGTASRCRASPRKTLGQHVSLSGKVEKLASGIVPHDPSHSISPISSTASAAVNAKTSTPKSSKGTVSAVLCHLGNISYQLGTEVPSPIRRGFGGDKAAYEAWGSMKQHLVDAAGMKLDDATYRLGRRLGSTPRPSDSSATRKPTGCSPRTYRAPYVVPEQV